ncbi:hypothetical protein [Burkholderia sp. Ac-20365]|uniref:competence protein CoiA n=1 Tax=Burkholderia sp. Ac-20365 TaxID=2703897 RepID=UPI00197B2C1D|nr:hypothetical protein [Burkholderia sp. Ac-20365]MBN3761155.1 hypothetical protein [Burkholderia sp. Ac-20365]
MPLKCLSPDGPVHAFDFTREQFELLRLKHKAQGHLSFKCCDGQVGLRASAGGIQHFYHVKRGGCRYEGGETLEHLRAKEVIVRAARRAGWHAETEFEDELGRWRADVLLTRGTARLAFEVQWSAQTWADTLIRQQRYRDSDVRGLWLFRRASYEPAKDTPAFQIRVVDGGSGFDVLISPPKEKWVYPGEADDWMDLSVFVHCALHRGLNFGQGASARRFSLRYTGDASAKPCACGVADLFVPYAFSATPLDLDGHRSYTWHRSQRWRYPPAWLNAFSRHCNATTRKLKLAYARKLDEHPHYFTWHCPDCDAEVSNLDDRYSTVEVKDTEVSSLPAPTPRSPEAKFANRWWIDPEVLAL